MKLTRDKTLLHSSVWIGAVIVGLAAVFYAKLVAQAQACYFELFRSHSYLVSVFSPLIFVVATFFVRRFAPDAKGSGIPQVLVAIETAKEVNSCLDSRTQQNQSTNIWGSQLVSLKTALIKVLSSVIGVLGGASIGREGPTVQIAASGFAWVGRKLHKWVPQIDFQSYLIAGAAAGVAAAFNTPLAGITFALEEIVDGAFSPFRQMVMLSVIIAGITAQACLGDYLYFGHPSVSNLSFIVILESFLIGIIGGFFGAGFAKVLAYPKLTKLPEHWIMRALICGTLCSLIGLFTQGDTAGSGYEVTRKALEAASMENTNLLFPFLKLSTTALSYLSGMAGGIFSPSLSIGAGFGIVIAKIAQFHNYKTCALLGMVAFFSGVVQAPLTAVIIVMEMTDEHILIFPFMVAAFLAQGVGKWIMPVPLYGFLARKHAQG